MFRFAVICFEQDREQTFKYFFLKHKETRCTRGVRVFFSVTGMRSSNSARINKFVFRTEKIV